MCIAIYARVSTEKQLIEGFGLDVQMKELKEEALKNGLTYKEYVDSGITGTSLSKRLGLQELLKDVKSGAIKEVWVTKLSRLGRNTRDVLNIIYEFERYNVIFKSKRDGIDTSTSMGKVMMQFMSIVSEMERDIIVETTKAGLDYRASIGKIYGCQPVLGYDRIGSGKTSFITINKEESQTVKKIFTLYIKGYGYKAIANKLNCEGLKTKQGNFFSINTVKNILSNPLYVGKIRYNLFKDWSKKRRRGMQQNQDIILVDGLHKNIISKSKWEKVQKIKSQYKSKKTLQSPHYMLSGKIMCPDCNKPMVGVKGFYRGKNGENTYRYYVCSGYHNKGKYVCNSNSINSKLLDNDLLKRLINVFDGVRTQEKSGCSNEIYKRLTSQDDLLIKRLLKVLVCEAEYNYSKRNLGRVMLNFKEDTFEILGVKYAKRHENNLKEILSPLGLV
jgi:site-specific DNA recombinase